jgi:hypothetical protein
VHFGVSAQHQQTPVILQGSVADYLWITEDLHRGDLGPGVLLMDDGPCYQDRVRSVPTLMALNDSDRWFTDEY